ncbi:hypothetical protein [Janthinobacterium sp. RB2R34]|uniref:hypothetical protein n=1 Tax=Janthinobacterium sp. RB2R34 TaxID=3424193 RepID=UPI003F263069
MRHWLAIAALDVTDNYQRFKMINLPSNSYLEKHIISKHRKIFKGIFLALSALASTEVARAAPADGGLYRDVLKVIFTHQKPQNFAVWDQKIGSATMMVPRVPRHDPEHQLARSLPGLPAELEDTLLAPGSGGDADNSIPRFDVPASTAAFSGFLGRDKLERAEMAADPKNAKSWLTTVGFSKIAYANNGHSALIYAETCLNGSGELCGATGFWFVQAGAQWRLKRSADLWQGVTEPFWAMPAAVAVNTLK